jgi:catechol 2,3-dioxygenase-like lactoylglutathione lyase family enzyme
MTAMTFSIDAITLGVVDTESARHFYTDGLGLPVLADHGHFVSLGLGEHAAPLGLYTNGALASDAQVKPDGDGFRGFTISYLVEAPAAVDLVVETAVAAGARVIKPAKKSIWGGYGGVLEAPDGAIWKIVTPAKKGGPITEIPAPTDVPVLIGVADVKASVTFYESLGLPVRKSYGGKYADFVSGDGTSTLGLYPWEALAKDAGVPPEGNGFRSLTLSHIVETPEQVDAALAAAAAGGGSIAVPAEKAEWGGYSGYLADPDGFLWKVVCS